MSITGCYYRLIELLSKPYDFFIDLSDIVIRVNIFVSLRANHEVVVSHRLNLKIVIEVYKTSNFLWWSSLYNCSVEFAGAAGASNNKSFSVFHKFTLWNKRESSEIIYMRLADKSIEINSSQCVLGKNNAVVRTKVPDHLRGWFTQNIYISKILSLLFF